ncbi:helix-turn-helix transcriptional regulator [Thomasclavelia sp.]|uniref:helix-turn-helix transcriptional regulator n=1 Tax=Thomasclavelia sp. TaxID=3025757 RepID=UPI0025ED748B|nr:helix-turn-helix transcriptional regulator [Thomasclavelia sp.]
MKTRIPELRKKMKITQEELALSVGVTRQTITSIEVGKYSASLLLAYKIAKYFNLSIEDVFYLEEELEKDKSSKNDI